MATVVLVGLEDAVARQFGRVLDSTQHRVEQQPQSASLGDFVNADIIFAGGEPNQYMSLLRRVREKLPSLPFVVVTRMPETKEWLDALEAGATDYCSVPFESRQVHWLMESALPTLKFATA